MVVEIKTKSLEEIFDEMIESYTQGDYLEGCTPYGDDALMSPKTFAERFQNVCLGFGYREAEIIYYIWRTSLDEKYNWKI